MPSGTTVTISSAALIHQLAHILLDPLLVFWLFLLAGGAFYFRPSKKIGHWIVGFGLFWLFVISTTPVPVYLTAKRERRYHQLTQQSYTSLRASQPQHIMVLGAGHSNAPNFTVQNRLSEPALKRLLEGIRLKQQIPTAKLVCSGYSSSGRQSQAEAFAALAIELGVSPQDTLLQPKAFNTEAEARTYAQRFGKDTPLILVTSALHMPRAMFWFRHYGLDPIPAPTNYLVMPDPGYETFTWGPSTRKIAMTRKLLHEYAGMLYAKWKVRK